MRDNIDVASNTTHTDEKNRNLQDKATLDTTPQTAVHPENKEYLDFPYKGLNPYTEADTSIFFGREQDIQNIVNNLLAWRLTIVYGKSGVGKSSALRAGVTHTLNEEARQNITDYGVPKLAVVVFPSLDRGFSWKDEPLTGLMKHIEKTIAHMNWGIKPPPPGLSFVETLEAWTEVLGGKAGNGELYLILDQFEEYFLYHTEETSEYPFYTEFSRAVNCSNLRVNFLISIREDSIATLDRFQPLIPNLFEHRLSIGHLDGQAGREAITKPIAYYNQQHSTAITIEPALVDTILDEVQVGRVQLEDSGLGGIDNKPKPASVMQIETPYLQLVMERLWQEELDQGSQRLRLETFKALGQADTIVKDHLNRQMQLLTEKERQLAVSIFQKLVTSSGTKHAYSILDLAAETGCDPSQLKGLLERLAGGQQRIVRPIGLAKRNRPDTQSYEIFHDALAKAVLAWRRQYLEQQKRAEELAEQHGKLRRRIGFAIGGASLFTALLVGVVATWQISLRKKAVLVEEQKLEINKAVQQAKTGSQIKALQNVMQAVQIMDRKHLEQVKPDATLGLQTILSGIQEQNQFQVLPEGAATAIQAVLSPTEELAATASLDGRVKISTLNGKTLSDFQAASSQPTILAFLEGGQRLAVAAMDGTVGIWSIHGKPLAEFNVPKEAGYVSSFSPDGQRLITIDSKGIGRLWTLASKQQTQLSARQSRMMTASFSLDGQRIATASVDGIVRLWDTQGNLLREISGHRGPVYFVKFRPEGQKLVTGGQDGPVRLWNFEGKQLKEFPARYGAVYYLDISRDGRRVATSSANGTVRLWDEQGNLLAELGGHENVVSSVYFDRDGKGLATITRSGTVHLWALSSQNTKFSTFQGPSLRANIQFSADGQSLITAGGGLGTSQGIAQWSLGGRRQAGRSGSVLSFVESDGQLRYVTVSSDRKTISIHTFQQEKPLFKFSPIQAGMFRNAELSPNGKWLATIASIGEKRIAQVWNLEQEKPYTIHLKDEESVVAIKFVPPAGKQLATVSLSGKVYLWDPTALQNSPSEKVINTRGSFVSALEFSPVDQQFALATWDNTTNLWDWQGKEPQPLKGHQAPVRNIHFSADGQRLLTSSMDGTARLWDLQGHQWAEYPGHLQSGVLDAVFSPDEQQVAMISLDGSVQLWPVENFEQLVKKGCNWLADYLATHPDVQKQLTVCEAAK